MNWKLAVFVLPLACSLPTNAGAKEVGANEVQADEPRLDNATPVQAPSSGTQIRYPAIPMGLDAVRIQQVQPARGLLRGYRLRIEPLDQRAAIPRVNLLGGPWDFEVGNGCRIVAIPVFGTIVTSSMRR